MDIITTENLKIRKFSLDDAHAYFINNNELQVKEYMPNHYQSDEDKAREEIESFIASYKNTEIEYHYAVVKDDILIGHVGIGATNIGDGVSIYEICCAINKNYRGYGYAAEATKGFVIWCKNTFGLAQIYASTDRENIASNKTLLKAGCTLTNMKIKELKVYIFN